MDKIYYDNSFNENEDTFKLSKKEIKALLSQESGSKGKVALPIIAIGILVVVCTALQLVLNSSLGNKVIDMDNASIR